MIVDCALYENGIGRKATLPVGNARAAIEENPQGFLWIGMFEPTEDEINEVSQEFNLHPLASEDVVHAHQRPKLENYDGVDFIVIKTARYVDSQEVVEIGEVMAFLGPRFLITIRHGAGSDLGNLRKSLEAEGAQVRWTPLGILHAVLDKVVDDYGAVLAGLELDVDEIEQQVFGGNRVDHAERVYKLKREVSEFRRAIEPLGQPLEHLHSGIAVSTGEDLEVYFRDVYDHLLRQSARVEAFDSLLTTILNANLAQVGVRQNEDMRKISAWVAIVGVPTMIAGVYGMNFEHMPELGWRFGYPLALVLMLTACLLLFRNFKRNGWL